jgi:hypothetical protein
LYKIPDHGFTEASLKDFSSANSVAITVRVCEHHFIIEIEPKDNAKLYYLYNARGQIRYFKNMNGVFNFCEKLNIKRYTVDSSPFVLSIK